MGIGREEKRLIESRTMAYVGTVRVCGVGVLGRLCDIMSAE